MIRASAMYRAALCPGSWRAAQGLPEQPNEFAERGTRVHAILADALRTRAEIPRPTGDAIDDQIARALWDRFRRDIAHGREYEADIEVQMEAVDLHLSGRADAVLAFRGDDGIDVLDWKTGWSRLPDAAENAQLRVYAVLAARAYGAETVRAHLIQPARATTVEIREPEQFASELQAIAEAALADDAPRKPSPEACQWCRALGTERCPESLALLPAAHDALSNAKERALAMPPEQVAKLLDLGAVVEKLIKTVREAAKERLAQGEEIPGWRLKPGAVRRNIADALKAVEALEAAGVPRSIWLLGATLSLRDLARAVADARGWKLRDAEEWLSRTIGEWIEQKQTEPTLWRDE